MAERYTVVHDNIVQVMASRFRWEGFRGICKLDDLPELDSAKQRLFVRSDVTGIVLTFRFDRTIRHDGLGTKIFVFSCENDPSNPKWELWIHD